MKQDELDGETLQFFFDQCPLMAAIAGEDGRLRHINALWSTDLGLSEADLLAMSIPDIVHQDDRAQTEAALATLDAPGKRASFESRFKNKAGELRWLHWDCRRSGGEILAVVKDTTHWKEYLEKQRKDTQRLLGLVRSAPVAIIEYDMARRITSWNPAAEQIFGYSSREVLGRNASYLRAPDSKVDVEKTQKELLERGYASFTSDNITKDGRRITCEWQFMWVRDDQGNILSLAGLVREVTERNRMEQELRSRFELIEKQRSAMRAMAVPIIQVWDDVLALPIVGVVDSARAADLMETLLAAVARTAARFAILDLTGVDTVDTSTADHLLKMVQAAGLLGASVLVTGIRPSMARILVSLGADLTCVATLRNLRDAIRLCMRDAG